MDELTRTKLYLNIPLEDNSQDPLLGMLIEESLEEIAAYTNRGIDELTNLPVGRSAAIKAAVVKYNRRGTEGMTSQSFSGSNEGYVEGLTAEIKSQLNSIRRVKVL